MRGRLGQVLWLPPSLIKNQSEFVEDALNIKTGSGTWSRGPRPLLSMRGSLPPLTVVTL